MKPRTVAAIIALAIAWLALPSRPQDNQFRNEERGFAAASPESQGISSERLRSLASAVRGSVGRDEIIGAELLVIKNRRTILHEALGWRDREQKIPMERNTIFNVRSMTKPLTGMAAQMLIDAGRLGRGDRLHAHPDGRVRAHGGIGGRRR